MSARLWVRGLQNEDLPIIAARMRESDRREILAANQETPLAALRSASARSSFSGVMILEGEPIAAFGVVPLSMLNRETGVIWLLGTDAITQNSREFLRVSKRIFPSLTAGWKRLINFVDARNTASVKWVEWLGFRVFPAEPYGISGLPFHRIELEV